MLKLFMKWLGIGIGIGVAIYAAGFAKDYKEQQEIARERDRFGTGE
ncbi:hypothetical protein K8O68_02185 [Salipaludibacillus sp. CUR1]|uniref:Uncharacterized protein n=1 Tax=Salipaludibacillus aurantiacus TaxID=1601833 RepID=A0A1H9WCH8_9BACI|nr:MULTISPECIES: hypothetical protein [Salipaludibacillus]MCE7791227.1 hypothetical protein [Salipaludibacillus sp. CUR1]SES31656.1 hypothetical protein SAMN05518684_11626 [Salipaludibacillus aurantiacus]